MREFRGKVYQNGFTTVWISTVFMLCPFECGYPQSYWSGYE
ncbi:hypothetical protein HMPREF6485_0703 [Segatella buccae ATCC 33574]|uniref:Uncharacterized protein n=1 Tax=Segatella buccae ATCC 33574 TaxID=873513 RepID=E6K4Y5_9BACT|nr:hypothetical protein HMPREF6485_0703 [Segatella buccae ATCC 33574]